MQILSLYFSQCIMQNFFAYFPPDMQIMCLYFLHIVQITYILFSHGIIAYFFMVSFKFYVPRYHADSIPVFFHNYGIM